MARSELQNRQALHQLYLQAQDRAQLLKEEFVIKHDIILPKSAIQNQLNIAKEEQYDRTSAHPMTPTPEPTPEKEPKLTEEYAEQMAQFFLLLHLIDKTYEQHPELIKNPEFSKQLQEQLSPYINRPDMKDALEAFKNLTPDAQREITHQIVEKIQIEEKTQLEQTGKALADHTEKPTMERANELLYGTQKVTGANRIVIQQTFGNIQNAPNFDPFTDQSPIAVATKSLNETLGDPYGVEHKIEMQQQELGSEHTTIPTPQPTT